jgi:hypothetical protein
MLKEKSSKLVNSGSLVISRKAIVCLTGIILAYFALVPQHGALARIKSDNEVDLEEEFKKALENQPGNSENLAPGQTEGDDKSLEKLEEELTGELDTYNPEEEENEQVWYYNKAIIKVLNKITTRTETLNINVGSSQYFGNTEIFPIRCIKQEDYYGSNCKVLLKILEHKIDRDSAEIFHGWLFSGYPGFNSPEHPVYFTTVIDCKNKIY